MDKVRRKVLQQFTRNIGGAIVSGHPEHPDEHGRFLKLDPDVAAVLASEGLVSEEDSTEKFEPIGGTPAPKVHEVSKAIAAAIDGAIKAAAGSEAPASTPDNSIAGLIAEGEGEGEGGGNTGGTPGNVEGASGDVAGGVNSSQAVRERQAAGKPAPADQKRRGASQRGGRTPKTKAPAGGSSEAAVVNHPIESGPNTPPAEIPGNGSPPDDDSPPTGGEG